jgi:hypothetical protein
MGISTLKEILLDIERSSRGNENTEVIPEKLKILKEQTVYAIKELEDYKTKNQSI